jgi:shikimate dehydrogenase
VNTLRREPDGSWSADMFDGTGMVRAFERKGVDVAGRRVALFGAGGAGSAIACALAEAKVSSIDVIDVDARKADALVSRLRDAFPGVAAATAGAAGQANLVVNASPVGMHPADGLPGALGELERGTAIGDVVVSAQPTAIIRFAQAHGCTWVDGKDLHAGQIDVALEYFRLDGARSR